MSSSVIVFDEKRLERLPPREFSRHLMALPARQRLEAILQRRDAEAVVAALAEQDFYLTVKEIGADDALPLLSLARVGQLTHLFDLEWWQKDRIEPARAVDWLERLARASEEKLLAWLYDADFELLVSLFKRWIRIGITPEDIDPVEATEQLPAKTLDDQYYWEAVYPQYEEFLYQLLGLLFEVHYGFYKKLMNHILSEAEIEIDEDAYRFHRARLEDLAIPDFYDALEIYRALRPEELRYGKDILPEDGDGRGSPSFALALLPEKDFLSKALKRIRDASLIETLQRELAALANKVVVADQLRPDSPEALHHAVDKVAAYVSLGLQLKTGGNLDAAARVLQELFLEHLFRLGQAPVARLRGLMRQMKERGWISQWPGGLKCLESQWMEAAELLLSKTPRLVRSAPDSDQASRPDLFRSRRDLSKGKHLIEVIEVLGALYEALHVQPERLAAGLWPEAQIHRVEEITLGAMLCTAAAQRELSGEWKLDPIPAAQWPGLAPRLQPERMKALLDAWVGGVLSEPARRSLAEAYLQPLLDDYAEEMAPFGADRLPDPRLMKHFLFTRG